MNQTIEARRAARKDQIAQEKRTVEEEHARLMWACSMRSLTELTEAINVPSELAPALMTNRPELIKLARLRAYSAEEVGQLFEVLRVLMETNDALRLHAQIVARQTSNLESAIKGMMTAARKIGALAEFSPDSNDEENDDGDD